MSPAVSGLIGALIATALTTYIARSRARVVNGETVLRQPWFLLLLWIPLTSVFATFAVLNALGASRVNSYAVAVTVPAVLTLVGAYLSLEALFVTVVLGRDSLRASTPWRGHREIPWDDIVHASFSSAMGWYVLRTRTHGVVRVSGMLKGARQLEDILTARGIPLSR